MELNGKVVLMGLVSPLGVVCILVVVWLISMGWPYGEVAAAWVQAIGSVVAIFTAWIFPYVHDLKREARQVAVKERQEIEQQYDYMCRVLGVINHAKITVEVMPGWFGDGFAGRLDVEASLQSLRDSIDTLRSVDVFKLPTVETASAVLATRRYVSSAMAAVSALAENDEVIRQHSLRGLMSCVAHIEQAYGMLDGFLAYFAKRHGL